MNTTTATATATRYFAATALKDAAKLMPGGVDELTFYIVEVLSDSAVNATPSEMSWESAGLRARAQTLPVRYISGDRVKDYGIIFDTDAYERVIYNSYARDAVRPLNFDTWVRAFRSDAELDNPQSDINQATDSALIRDYPRYVELRDAAAVTQPTAAQQLEKRRQQPVREEGIYQDASDDVFKVVRSSYDRLYAKQLIDGKFEYAPGALRRLTAADKLSLAQAERYGKLTGHCCRCGARLTDEDSIARGVGPVCATYF